MQLIAHSNLAMSGIVERMPNHRFFDPSLDPILRIRLTPVDLQCRTPNLALNSMRLDRFVNEAQVGTGVSHLLGIEVFAKRDERLLRPVIS